MNITIFFCWQSTTDTTYNRNFIFTSLEKAVKRIKNKPEFVGVDFELIDAVRGLPGSPSIATKITDERIPSSDIFIADLSVVNQIHPFSKWVQGLFGDKFKPFQNNNVINEHGVALNALGRDKIIGVLNTYYGSPKDNPDNIPFDLAHMSFPIEYKYSKSTKDKKAVQDDLVSKLASALRPTILHALQTKKSKHTPFLIWSDWSKTVTSSEGFIQNNKIDEIQNAIIDGLAKSYQSIRLLGLSGLGKTRILFELFRPDSQRNGATILSSRIFYINCSFYPNTDYPTLISKIISQEVNPIIVLDNCGKDIHRQLLSYFSAGKNKGFLISIDSSPEEFEQDAINNVNYLILKKEDLTSVVDEILIRDFKMLSDENRAKIIEFSQGIPLMAVLLAESVRDGEQFIGKLNDKDLLNKLLGKKGQEVKDRTILKAAAIFNYFGYEESLGSQVKFIATNKSITAIDGTAEVLEHDFRETCNHYLKRQIFERKGRFIGMRPFPLALSLAQEWLEPCTSERWLKVITDIANLPEPDRSNLSEAMAEQMKYLGYSNKAIEIVDHIIGPNSPFDNAEVLNTELGSRLFRSFVEVNPEAVAANFLRNFFNKSTEDLILLVAGRRNIVWTLEKLAFDGRTFSTAAKLLMKFAVAENETWGNNSTGQFIHLFKVILPGTEASLQERLSIIKWGLSQSDPSFTRMSISAMNAALDFGSFTRAGGAEMQGTRQLKDFHPNFEDIKVYWTNVLILLRGIVKDNSEYSDLGLEIIAKSIRSVIHGRSADIIIKNVIEISHERNYDWDDALINLRHALKFDKSFLSSEQQEIVSQLIQQLTKTDFPSIYKQTVKNYYYSEDVQNRSEENHIRRVEKLAEEFLKDELSLEQYIPLLYEQPQVYGYYFGKKLHQLLVERRKEINPFITASISFLASSERGQIDSAVLAGFVSVMSKERREKFYSIIQNHNELNYLLFYFYSLEGLNEQSLLILFNLIDNKKADISEFKILGYNKALLNISKPVLFHLINKLLAHEMGAQIAFELLDVFTIFHENEFEELIPLFRKVIKCLGVSIAGQRDYKYFFIIEKILKESVDVELAHYINNAFIDSISWNHTYVLSFEAQRIYSVLLEKYFDFVWPDLSDALLADGDAYLKYYGLKNILGSYIGGLGPEIGILFKGDVDKLFSWCAQHPEKAPPRLGELVPIFQKSNDDRMTWHPICKKLIDDFGSNDKTLDAIQTNMGNFSWTGSVVPLLQDKKELFSQLLNHPESKVQAWAEKNFQFLQLQIASETLKDQEWNL